MERCLATWRIFSPRCECACHCSRHCCKPYTSFLKAIFANPYSTLLERFVVKRSTFSASFLQSSYNKVSQCPFSIDLQMGWVKVKIGSDLNEPIIESKLSDARSWRYSYLYDSTLYICLTSLCKGICSPWCCLSGNWFNWPSAVVPHSKR